MNGQELPGVGTTRTATPRKVLITDQGKIILPRGRIIDGSESRDPLNTGDVDVLRAGMIMGRIGSTGLYAPSIVGLSTADYTDNETTITCSEATATEVLRRVGADFSSNDVLIVGAPTATGVVATFSVTLTAITLNGAASTIETGDLNADIESGALICIDDGSYIPNLILGSEYGVKVTDIDNNSIDAPMREAIVGGFIDTNVLVNYPAVANTTLRQWLRTQLKSHCAGLYYASDFDNSASVETTIEESDAFFASTDITGGEAETLTDGSDADLLHDHALADASDISASALINIPLQGALEADGSILSIWADASSPTPGRYAAAEYCGIKWNDHGSPDPIVFSIPYPTDLDPAVNVILHISAFKVGATAGDAVTWDVEAFENVQEALYDAGADFGGTSSAMTGDATTLTVQEETLILANANVNGAPAILNLTIHPTDGKLGTDDVVLIGLWLEYTRKLLT